MGCGLRCAGMVTGSVETTRELCLEAVFLNVGDFFQVMVPLDANLASLGKHCEVVSSSLFAIRDSGCSSTELPLLCIFLQGT